MHSCIHFKHGSWNEVNQMCALLVLQLFDIVGWWHNEKHLACERTSPALPVISLRIAVAIILSLPSEWSEWRRCCFRSMCVCMCVCVQWTGQSDQCKTVKATDFKFDVHVPRDSPDFQKGGVARVTLPLIFGRKMLITRKQLKLRTSNLACTFPGTVQTWPVKKLAKKGRL